MSKLTIVGASGRTGIPLVNDALAVGHDVTAFVRDPAKLGIQHERLQVAQGDIRDAQAVSAAIAGADAVLSVIGQTRPATDNLLATAVQNIVQAMDEHHVRRFVYLTGAGVKHPNDKPGMADKVMGTLLKLMAGSVLEDSVTAARIIESSDLEWVIVRAPRLSDEPGKGQYRTGYLQPGFSPLSRADVADFMLKQVSDNTWVHEMPMISN